MCLLGHCTPKAFYHQAGVLSNSSWMTLDRMSWKERPGRQEHLIKLCPYGVFITYGSNKFILRPFDFYEKCTEITLRKTETNVYPRTLMATMTSRASVAPVAPVAPMAWMTRMRIIRARVIRTT